MNIPIKKIISIIILFVGILQVNAQGLVTGIGVTYGSEINYGGFNLREYYFVNHRICLGPEVSYFPKHNLHGHEASLLELNITGHYIFELTETIGFYPLTGLNYSIEETTIHEHSTIEKAFGINLGAGFHYKINNILPFVEYKYITENLAQHVYSIGTLIMFGKKKHTTERHQEH